MVAGVRVPEQCMYSGRFGCGSFLFEKQVWVVPLHSVYLDLNVLRWQGVILECVSAGVERRYVTFILPPNSSSAATAALMSTTPSSYSHYKPPA